MYDVCNRESFKNCIYWLQNVRSYADENVVVALVGNSILIISIFLGNKTDILHVNQNRREVPKEEAEKFARDNNLIFIGEASS